jgi:hypothetical protein
MARAVYLPFTVRWPSGRRRRFAKAAENHKTGLKSTISGPFFIGTLVGVGCGMMVLGPRLGTLVGTLEPMPMCALWAHVVQRDDDVYLVPFVEDEHTVFLKTIIPSRKATKQYLGEESDHED